MDPRQSRDDTASIRRASNTAWGPGGAGREEKLKLDCRRNQGHAHGPRKRRADDRRRSSRRDVHRAHTVDVRSRPGAVKRLFEDYVAVERAYYRKTAIFRSCTPSRSAATSTTPTHGCPSLFGVCPRAAHRLQNPTRLRADDDAAGRSHRSRPAGHDGEDYVRLCPQPVCSTRSCAVTTSRGCPGGGCSRNSCSHPDGCVQDLTARP